MANVLNKDKQIAVTLWNGENDQRLIRIVGMLRCLGMWEALDKPGFDISFSMDMQ